VASSSARQPVEYLKSVSRALKGRIRRITIVAVARKLLITLWRYLETGMVPTGAILN